MIKKKKRIELIVALSPTCATKKKKMPFENMAVNRLLFFPPFCFLHFSSQIPTFKVHLVCRLQTL